MIQIDMPMPKNCLECPACNEYLNCAIPVNGRGWGENDVREFGQGRPEWCPLKEQEAKLVRIDEDSVHCPSCGNELFTFPRQKFCDECGQAVKWE